MPKTLSDADLRRLEEYGYEKGSIKADRLAARPEIYRGLLKIAQKAGVEEPELFVGKLPFPEITSVSIDKIVISDDMLKILNDKEVVTLLAGTMENRLRHDKDEHHLYLAMGVGAAGFLGTMGAYKWNDHRKKRATDRREFNKQVVYAYGAGVLSGKTAQAIPQDNTVPSLVEDKKALQSAWNKVARARQAQAARER